MLVKGVGDILADTYGISKPVVDSRIHYKVLNEFLNGLEKSIKELREDEYCNRKKISGLEHDVSHLRKAIHGLMLLDELSGYLK
jgi:hypothetical protein